jgi:hypothetical protein
MKTRGLRHVMQPKLDRLSDTVTGQMVADQSSTKPTSPRRHCANDRQQRRLGASRGHRSTVKVVTVGSLTHHISKARPRI